MKTLSVNIQREWLARIIDGSKRIEFRDASNYWINRLLRVGVPPFHLRLINGMRPDSPEALVLVDKVEIDLLEAQIRFHLAKILSTTRWNPAWHANSPPLEFEVHTAFTPSTADRRKKSAHSVKVAGNTLQELRVPGNHIFKAPTTDEVSHEINGLGPEPFMLTVADGETTMTSIAYQVLFDPFAGIVEYHVHTPQVSAS